MEGVRWLEIRNDRLKGMNYTEPGKKYNIDPRTAKKYAESPERPEYRLSAPKPTKLDAYKQQVDMWLEEAPYSAVRILEKLVEEGFDGKYSIVKEYVRSKKMDLDEKVISTIIAHEFGHVFGLNYAYENHVVEDSEGNFVFDENASIEGVSDEDIMWGGYRINSIQVTDLDRLMLIEAYQNNKMISFDGGKNNN